MIDEGRRVRFSEQLEEENFDYLIIVESCIHLYFTRQEKPAIYAKYSPANMSRVPTRIPEWESGNQTNNAVIISWFISRYYC